MAARSGGPATRAARWSGRRSRTASCGRRTAGRCRDRRSGSRAGRGTSPRRRRRRSTATGWSTCSAPNLMRLPIGSCPGQKRFDDALADDDRRRRGVSFGVGERAAGDDRNAQRAEELRRDAVDVRARHVLRGRPAAALRRYRSGARRCRRAAGRCRGRRRRRRARRGAVRAARGLGRPAAAAAPCGAPAAAAAGGADARGMLTRSVSTESRDRSPGSSAVEVADRADHQAGADEQHDRQRHLHDDERVAQPLRPAAVAAARRFLERVCSDRPLAPAGPARADEDAARERDGDGERAPRAGRVRARRSSGNVTGLCASSAATAPRASSRPAAAPSSVSTQLSVISWRSSRPRRRRAPCARRSRAAALPTARSAGSRRSRRR